MTTYGYLLGKYSETNKAWRQNPSTLRDGCDIITVIDSFIMQDNVTYVNYSQSAGVTLTGHCVLSNILSWAIMTGTGYCAAQQPLQGPNQYFLCGPWQA